MERFHKFFATADAALLGVARNRTIFVVHLATDDIHLYTFDGEKAQKVPPNTDLPPDLITPKVPNLPALTFGGPRHYGNRAEERIDDAVYPLAMPQKMALGEQLGVMPPLVLGLTESYVTSAANLPKGSKIVCRRVRVAYALMAPDEDGNTYDSAPLWLAQVIDDTTNADLTDLTSLPGVVQPLDVVVYDGYAVLYDGAGTLHIYHVG